MKVLKAIRELQTQAEFNPEITGHGVSVAALHEKLPRVTYLKMVSELRQLEKDGEILTIVDGDGWPSFVAFNQVEKPKT
jgi:hypothetical protein